MAIDANKRVLNWNAKFNTERTKQALDVMRPEMAQRYRAAVVALCEMESNVKILLNMYGVQTVLYVSYLNFGRQLYKLSRKRNISGNAFALAAQVLIGKWSSRGLDPEVLATIRTQVFDIGAPPAP
jgi:hypothetical protein